MTDDLKLEIKLLKKVKKFYCPQYSSRTIDEIKEIIRNDPILFECCLKRAENYMNENSTITKNRSIWIACNLVDSVRNHATCYFCEKKFTRDDLLKGNIHLEHFEPRRNEGENEPGNITLACKDCNLLKSDLTSEDFIQILNEPNSFFLLRKVNDNRQKQLIEFAEIYYPRIAGLSEYAKRHNINDHNIRAHWENLRQKFRNHWRNDI